MKLNISPIPPEAFNEKFVICLRGLSLATTIAALRAFVDQPETHDLAKDVHNEIVDQANTAFRMRDMSPMTTRGGLVVRNCTRDQGHSGPCNGYPRPGCPVSFTKLADRPDFHF